MNYQSVSEVKAYFGVSSDEELAKKLAELNILRVGSRQTVYLWNGTVPKYVQTALELHKLKSDLQATA